MEPLAVTLRGVHAGQNGIRMVAMGAGVPAVSISVETKIETRPRALG